MEQEDIKQINDKIISNLNHNSKNYEKIFLVLDNRTLILMERINCLTERLNHLEDKFGSKN